MPSPGPEPALTMYLVPCSCGTTFAVPDRYDQHGGQWSRYLVCPGCGKRHDPRNRLLHLGYHREGYWKVDACQKTRLTTHYMVFGSG